ncbi:recombinase family protein [Clostridium botulinum]|uniref:recombinase family protein n=1 Tax=Clostridium botulinum TaxID=1491 RepID=UPI00077441B7|nr:recombinase family protein [Clostridium botulinum]MBY6930901.1 recombinase family protein [Clostridium botulinum]NFG21130.1 recombinase family protein [Clostridium botulinum]NFO80006.1 recombinase family protein [Clostridium botulinum]
MCNVYFYMRISTKESNDKQSFNRQEKSLKAYAHNNGMKFSDRHMYKDDITGSTFDRPEWNELEGNLKTGDTVIFKEISRFTRQAEEGYIKYMELMQNGINLVFIDNPTVSTEYIKNLTKVALDHDLVAKTALESTIKLLLIVELDRVQKEREIIVKRIKQGIQASEKIQGRKQGQLDKMSEVLREDIKKFMTDRSIKQIDLMKKHDISRNTLKKYVKVMAEKNSTYS